MKKKFRFYEYEIVESGKVDIYQRGKLIHTASDLDNAEEFMQQDLINY